MSIYKPVHTQGKSLSGNFKGSDISKASQKVTVQSFMGGVIGTVYIFYGAAQKDLIFWSSYLMPAVNKVTLADLGKLNIVIILTL